MRHKSEDIAIIPKAFGTEFNTNIKLGGKTYHLQTERGSLRNSLLTTRVYLEGEIVYTKKADHSDILNEADYDEKLHDLTEKQHRNTIKEFTKKIEENKKKSEYFDAAKKLLAIKNNRQALKILKEAFEEFPQDPFIMSYYGYMLATVEKKHPGGIKLCQKALEELNTPATPRDKSLSAALYLNLGKTYLAAGQKKAAMTAFSNGLKIDRANHDLLWELKKLGTRKKPPIPFLSRKNPINKYMGLLISKLKDR